MSAELLRRAADRLDALAEAATPGPWLFNAMDSLHDDAAGWVGHDRNGDGFQEFVASTANHTDGLGDGAYIAAMHPGVGKALAAWLRATADDWDRSTAPIPVSDIRIDARRALETARAILGEDA